MHPHSYGGGYGMGMNTGFGLVSFIVHIAITVLIIWLIIWALRRFGGGRGRRFHMWQAHSALNILNERFAKGEIDQKDYEERKKALMGETHTK